MRTIIGCLGLLVLAACSGESAQETTAEVVGGLVERGKGIAAGIGEGVDRGRESVDGPGGTQTTSRAAEILERVALEAIETRAGGPGVQVVVGFENRTDRPLHIAGIGDEGHALLVDSQGFVTPLASGPHTVAIPASSKVRVELGFAGDPAQAARLRLWGTELVLPPAAE